MDHLPAAGERVLVPFGLDMAEGTVVAAYSGGSGDRVTVALDLDGSEEPTTVTFPLSAIAPAPATCA